MDEGPPSPPTFADVLEARLRVRGHLEPTPLRRYPALSALTGAETWVKHDNFLPTGAFKVRGGINLVSQLSDEERRRGVIAASTGNHGQSVAYAGRLFGVKALVCVPAGANRLKVAGIEEMGAEVVAHGADYDEAREHCEELARRHGYRYVHSANEPMLIAGTGTCALETLEAQPDLEVIVVPIGGGHGAAAASIVARSVNPRIEVIGVQSESSPAAYLSWREGRLRAAENRSFAEGIATGMAFELPQRILRDLLADFVLVSDDEIRRSMLLMVEHTRTLTESSGAAPLAAALRLRERLAGRKVALFCTGANVTPEQLSDVLAAPRAETPPAMAG